MTIHEEKLALREKYRNERKNADPARIAAASEAICRRILTLACYRYATSVLLYAAMPGELDLSLLARKAEEDGKAVAYPRSGKDGELRFYLVKNGEVPETGLYGIREPAADAPAWESDGKPSLCVVPGLVFDRAGMRIGYGGGYFDRFLSSYHGTTVGAALSELVVPRLPRGRYDLPVDVIVTEKEVRIPREKR